ncbi:MAG: phage portal protein [Finegoldia magna]|nr:phage portal protein [Finegoldia magna]
MRQLQGDYDDLHLRQYAVHTVVDRIINVCLLAQFQSEDSTNFLYKLNYKPNPYENGNEFKRKIITNMIYNGECVIVKPFDDYYVADSFSYDEKTKLFTVTTEYSTIEKTYSVDDVIHVRYNNVEFRNFLNSLSNSYDKLYKRVLEVQMRQQQIRVYAPFKGVSAKNEENSKRFMNFLSGMKKQLENESIAVVPRQDDYDVEEHSQNYLGRSAEELGTIENMYVKQVANILQVPPLLFSGDLADTSEHSKNFVRWCVKPIMNEIANEFNAKQTKSSLKNSLITVNTIECVYVSEFEMARDVEKMIGSGVWTIDDVLVQLGKKRENSKDTTRRYLTKNIGIIEQAEEDYNRIKQKK